MERVVRYLLPKILGLLSRTWRFALDSGDDRDHLVDPILDGAVSGVVMFLHGDMMPCWTYLVGTNGAPVVSSSRDGQRLVRFLEHQLGYQRFIRGSSSSGGKEVLDEMVDLLSDTSVLVTPDGPRGPSGKLKAGGVVASHRSKCPILLVAPQAKRAFRFSSWDSMRIPYPWSKVYIRYCILDSPTKIEEITPTITFATDWFSANSTLNQSDD